MSVNINENLLTNQLFISGTLIQLEFTDVLEKLNLTIILNYKLYELQLILHYNIE